EDEASGAQRTRLGMYGLLYDDLERIQDSFPAVRRTVPVKLLRREARLGGRTMELRIVGTTWEWFELVQRPLIAGRVLMPRDDASRGNAVVLTEYGAR